MPRAAVWAWSLHEELYEQPVRLLGRSRRGVWLSRIHGAKACAALDNCI
jgi:hypothetical protein